MTNNKQWGCLQRVREGNGNITKRQNSNRLPGIAR